MATPAKPVSIEAMRDEVEILTRLAAPGSAGPDAVTTIAFNREHREMLEAITRFFRVIVPHAEEIREMIRRARERAAA